MKKKTINDKELAQILKELDEDKSVRKKLSKKEQIEKNKKSFLNEINKLHEALKTIVNRYEQSESDLVDESLKDALKHLSNKEKKEALKILKECHELLQYDFSYLNNNVARCIDSIRENEIVEFDGYTPW